MIAKEARKIAENAEKVLKPRILREKYDVLMDFIRRQADNGEYHCKILRPSYNDEEWHYITSKLIKDGYTLDDSSVDTELQIRIIKW